MAGMGGASGSAMQTLAYPTLAFVFALILIGYSVWDLDQLSGRRYSRQRGPVPAGRRGGVPGDGRAPSPRRHVSGTEATGARDRATRGPVPLADRPVPAGPGAAARGPSARSCCRRGRRSAAGSPWASPWPSCWSS